MVVPIRWKSQQTETLLVQLLDLTVNPGPTVNAGSDITICEGETLDLSTRTTVASSSGASSTSWSDGSTGTFSDNSVLSPTYTPPTGVSNITLTFTGNGVAPCAFVDDFFTLTIQSLPSANAGSNDLELCQESSTTLGIGQSTSPSYSNAASVNWTVQSGNGSITSGTQNTLNPEYNAVASDGGNVVTLLMTANPITPCATTATSTVDLSVTAAPTAFAGSSQVICVDDTYTLDGTASVQNTSSYNWSVSSGGGTLSNVTSLSPTYSPTSGGQITLSLTAEGENSCPDVVSTVALTVREVDVEIVTDNDVLDIGESTVLSATHLSGGTYDSYSWTEASSLDNSTSQTVTASPVITTTYTVTATKDDCSASDELTVSVREPVLVPSMFTPGNSDGLNDNWILTNIEDYPTATIKVYNRWGNIVYKHYGGESYIDTPWDGTKGGDVVHQAVYYYVIDLDYKEIILKGSLTIMR